jgi:hypothetical protein
VEVDQQPVGVPDGWEVVATPSTPPPAKGRDFKILGVNIHVPAEQPARPDSNILSVGGVGVSPEDALMGGMATRAVVSSARSGGAVAGAVEAAKQATPLIKYEAAKAVYRGMGIPEPFAAVLASVTAGYKRGAKPVAEAPAGAPAPTAAPPAPYEQAIAEAKQAVAARPTVAAPASPPAAAPGAPAPPAAASVGTGGPPMTAAVPPAAPPAMPAGRVATPPPSVLDPAAQAIRDQTAPATATPVATPKLTLSAAEVSEIQRLTKQGKSLKEALDLVARQRALVQRLGLPTTADVKGAVLDRNAGGRWPE